MRNWLQVQKILEKYEKLNMTLLPTKFIQKYSTRN